MVFGCSVTCTISEISARGSDCFCSPPDNKVREPNLARGNRQAGTLKLLLGCISFMANH